MTDVRASPKTNGFLNRISVDDEEIIGYTEDGQPIYEAKKRRPSLSDMARDEVEGEAKSQLKKQGRELVKQAAGIGTGAGIASSSPEVAATGAEIVGSPFNTTMATSQGGGLPAAAAEASGFELSGIGSSGNYILPAAGAYGLYDLYANRPENVGHGSGYLQGAASGAALGSYFGPWGAGIGAGLGIAANALGIGGKSRTKIEEERRQALADQGINVPNYDVKEWEENEAFRGSRKESDLKGGDIENAATFYGITGYSQADQAKKEAIAQEAINQGLIREHHGTIDLSMTPEYQKYLESQLGGGAPTVSSGVNRGAIEAEKKKQRKRAILDSIMPEITTDVTKAPRYDLNPGTLINNPYL